jgi:hypothetical protein
MVIISGTRMAGRVDAIPRVGYVSTRFFHLYWVPLLPLQSFLVFSEEDDDINGVPIGLNWKSVLVGWLRGGLWLTLVAAPLLAVMTYLDHHPKHAAAAIAIWLLAAAALLLLYFWGGICEAKYERALELAQRAGLSPETRLMLEVAYGRLSADQAERELVRLIEQEQPAEQATW